MAKIRVREHMGLVWVALAVLVAGFPSLFYPFGKDQAVFAVVAQRWLAGGKPYEAAFDVKPPGIFAVYAAAEATLGHSMAAARVFDLLAVLLTAIGLYLLGRRASPQVGVLAGIAYPLAYYGIFGFWQTAQAEGFAAPCVVWGLLLCQKESWRPALIAGVLFGLATLLKTTMVVFAVLGCFSLRWQIRRCLPLAAGLLAPVALTVMYFGLRSMAELVAYQSSYASSPFSDLPDKFSALSHLSPPLALIGLALLLGIALIGLGEARRGAGFEYAWLGIALASVILQGRFYLYHFVVLTPPLCLVFARTLVALPAAPGTLLKLAAAALVLAGVPRFVVAAAMLTGGMTRDAYLSAFTYEDFSAADTARTADWINRHTSPGDTILVYSFDPGLYFLSDRFACTRHISIATLWQVGVPHELRQKWWDEIRADVDRNKPKVVVFYGPAARRDWHIDRGVVQFAGTDYELQTSNASFEVFAPRGAQLQVVSR